MYRLTLGPHDHLNTRKLDFQEEKILERMLWASMLIPRILLLSYTVQNWL